MVNVALFPFVPLALLVAYHPTECLEETFNVPDIVDKINSITGNLWTADTYGYNSLKVSEIKNILGTKLISSEAVINSNQKSQIITKDSKNLPTHFNWADTDRTNCPVGTIRNQGNCGSCWAVSTASAFSDRVCIKSKGQIRTPLSGNYIAACDHQNYGCNGGYMSLVNEFIKNKGVITGGEFESDEGCQPYSIRPCGYPYQFPCNKGELSPKCRQNKCTNDWYPSKFEKMETTYRAAKWYFTNMTEDSIRREIYDNGPVTAAFLVYNDFIYYKKGIYSLTQGAKILGGHAVKVVGWGEENDTRYWIVSNSWSEKWGESGYFRIKRGVNMCYFEEQISALIPE